MNAEAAVEIGEVQIRDAGMAEVSMTTLFPPPVTRLKPKARKQTPPSLGDCYGADAGTLLPRRRHDGAQEEEVQ